MLSEIVIKVDNISKYYYAYKGPFDRLKQILLNRSKHTDEKFIALDQISFEINRGDAIGIIGKNGSGKSTLLQMLVGTLTPTIGEIGVHGRVAALLELGSGFNPEFTGRENVFLNGRILGLNKKQITERFDQIVEFADIGEFIDQPVKTYSSGMFVRLAFSVVINVEPDILIVDEALSVGDFFFQQKCLDRIRAMQSEGMTLLFVSHDMGTVRDICQQAMFLNEGKLKFFGESNLAIRKYMSQGDTDLPSVQQTEKVNLADLNELDVLLSDSCWSPVTTNDSDSLNNILAVAFYSENNGPATSFRIGETITIKVAYILFDEVPAHISVELRNKYSQSVTSLGSSRLGIKPPKHQQRQTMIFEISIDLLLEAGSYSVHVNLGQPVAVNKGRNLDASPALGPITINWDYENEEAPFFGMVGLPSRGQFKLLHDVTEVE